MNKWILFSHTYVTSTGLCLVMSKEVATDDPHGVEDHFPASSVWDDHFPEKKTRSKGSQGGGGSSHQPGKVGSICFWSTFVSRHPGSLKKKADRDSLKSRWDQNDDPLNKAQINHQ